LQAVGILTKEGGSEGGREMTGILGGRSGRIAWKEERKDAGRWEEGGARQGQMKRLRGGEEKKEGRRAYTPHEHGFDSRRSVGVGVPFF